MTPETLRELEALYADSGIAKPAAYMDGAGVAVIGDYDSRYDAALEVTGDFGSEDDRWYYAHAFASVVAAFPALLAEIRRLEAENAALRERDEQHALLEEHRQQYADARLELIAVRRERDELKAECEWLRAFARAVSVADGWDYDDWRLAALTPSEKEKQT